MTGRTKPLKLYTIGHSSHDLAAFFDLLHRHSIHVLVDVRSAPYSRWVPHFNKSALEASCKSNEIDYRYAGQPLGGRPESAEFYTDGRLPDWSAPRDQYYSRINYTAVLRSEGYSRAIARLLDIIREQPEGANVSIMCSEGNPFDCHRHHLIARSLIDPAVRIVETPVEVIHILKDGATEVVQPEAFDEPPQQLSLL